MRLCSTGEQIAAGDLKIQGFTLRDGRSLLWNATEPTPVKHWFHALLSSNTNSDIIVTGVTALIHLRWGTHKKTNHSPQYSVYKPLPATAGITDQDGGDDDKKCTGRIISLV